MTKTSAALGDAVAERPLASAPVPPCPDPDEPCVAFKVSGLDCPDCARSVDRAVGYLEGVTSANLNFTTGLLVVRHEPTTVDPRAEVVSLLRRMGYGVEPVVAAGETRQADAPALWETYRHEIATAACGAFLLCAWALGLLPAAWAAPASAAAYAVAILVGGWITAVRAIASLRARALDMNVLMTLAVIGASAIGEYSEGAMVVFLFSLGGLLEARSLARTRRSIRELMTLAPPLARVRRGDAEVQVAPEDVAVGETLLVRPGERLALDGEVAGGSSAVDESPITGESMPAAKRAGDSVYAGTLNTTGLLEVRVTAPAADTTLARVIHLVEEAQAQRAPLQRLVDRFTRWYTPTVMALALTIAVVPPLLGMGAAAVWFYRALVLLVISCPCALVISTPVAIVSAITRATRDGVLVKGGAFLEAAARVRAIALDKTGTLTRGRPEVTDVVPLDGSNAEDVLRVAVALEAASTHPLAAAVLRAGASPRGAAVVTAFSEEPGRGVHALLDGVPHDVGSVEHARGSRMLRDGAEARVEALEAGGRTVLVVSARGEAIGLIGVSDEIREESADILDDLRRGGMAHVVMLTGDNERTAEAVARSAGVAEVRARLLPADKTAAVRDLKERYGFVAMVGDGINDAPALAAADIGIAMGAAGSDTALETADVALMADSLAALPGFFRLGRRTVANIRANVIVSVLLKLAVLVLAVFGRATLWMAVFADTGVALLVILNGLRLLRPERHGRRADANGAA